MAKSKQIKMIKAHCNACGGNTSHAILHLEDVERLKMSRSFYRIGSQKNNTC